MAVPEEKPAEVAGFVGVGVGVSEKAPAPVDTPSTRRLIVALFSFSMAWWIMSMAVLNSPRSRRPSRDASAAVQMCDRTLLGSLEYLMKKSTHSLPRR